MRKLAEAKIKGVEKVNQFLDAELIKPTEARIMKNMILDKAGEAMKAVKRGAINSYNGNAAGAVIRSLHDVMGADDNDYLLAMTGDGDADDDGVLQKSQGGTAAWANLKTGLDDSVGMRHTVFKDKVVLTNGIDVPILTDCATAWDLDIDAPDIQDMTAFGSNTAEGALTVSSLYRYVLIYVTEENEYSQASKPFTVITNATDIESLPAASYNAINFASMPISGDSRVTGRKLFRTEGDGKVFYLVASLDNETLTYIDEKSDDDLVVTGETLTIMTDLITAEQVVFHKDRLWLANVAVKYGRSLNTPASAAPHDTADPGDEVAGIRVESMSGTGGNMIGDGTYKYAISYLDVNGRESNLSAHTEFVGTGGANTTSKTTLASIMRPRIAAGGIDPGVTTIRVYRTAASGSTFYWVKDIQVNPSSIASTINDTIADTSLGTGSDADPATWYAQYPKATDDANDTIEYPSSVLFSEPQRFSNFTGGNFRQVFPDDGDEINGLVSQPDGLLIFKRRSINKIYTNGVPAQWRVVKLSEELGCDVPLSLKRAKDKVYFMSGGHLYRHPDRMAGSPVSQNFATDFNNITVRSATYNAQNQWYILCVYDSDESQDALYIYDEVLDAWYYFYTGIAGSNDAGDFYSIVDRTYGSDDGKIIIACQDHNYLLYYNPSGTKDYNGVAVVDDSTEIDCALRFKTFTIDIANELLRLRTLFSNYNKKVNQDVTHTLTDPQGSSLTIDDDSGSGDKFYKKDVDQMTGTGYRVNSFFYEISGTGLEEFNSAKILARVIREGTRRSV